MSYSEQSCRTGVQVLNRHQTATDSADARTLRGSARLREFVCLYDIPCARIAGAARRRPTALLRASRHTGYA
ncbi:hypothetical protein SSAG_00497 [Streptomyces sp. Mg1]|nr:hypothetical protein SSAG_00497 [Streptomyces sp. Mg1]